MSVSTAEFLWNPAEIGYFDPSRSGNAIGDVYQFIDRFTTVAFATNFEKVQANLHTCLLGPAGEWYKVLPDYHKKMLCYNDKAKNWIAALLERFDTEYRNKDHYQCLNRATHVYQQLERKYIEDCQRAQHEQRQRDNERREQQRLERVKRFEEQEVVRQQYEIEQQRLRNEQEIARQQYEMEQQRICEEQQMERQKRLDEQEIERQMAEQKAKDEAFTCRRCPEKFSSNTKLHKHIAAHHIKPARASSAALAPAQAVAISSSALPTPPTPTTPKIAKATLSAPNTPPASPSASTPTTPTTPTPPTTPKTMKQTCAMPKPAMYMTMKDLFRKFAHFSPHDRTPPTPPTTLKIAKSACATPNPTAYMTMDDLFRKFAPCDTQLPHRHVTKLKPQSLQTPLPSLIPRRKTPFPSPIRQKATVSRSLATFSAFDKRSHSRSSKSAPISAYTRFAAAAYQKIPTWEWTKQFGLRLRAWALL